MRLLQRKIMQHRLLAFGSLLGAAALVIALIVVTGGSATPKHPAFADTASHGTTAQSERDSFVQSKQADAPRLTLPATQRTAWITAWDQMATCMHNHGVATFPEAPATYGNGKTPAPIVGGPAALLGVSESTFQAAQAACPFNTSSLTSQIFEQAQRAWFQAHPLPHQTPPSGHPRVTYTPTAAARLGQSLGITTTTTLGKKLSEVHGS